MSTDARVHDVPAGSDVFDPQGDMVALSASLNDAIPAVNQTARDSALASVGATSGRPLVVIRSDTGELEVSWGSGFYSLSDHALTVLKSGYPADKANSTGATDLIASTDTGGIPSITMDPGGRITLDLSLLYVAATSSTAASATVSLLIDGAIVGTPWYLHTGVGALANSQKLMTVSLEGWVSPGTAHTVNARVTHTGGGGINMSQISYAVRG